MSAFLSDICNKLNLQHSDFFAFVGHKSSKFLFPSVLDSVNSAVVGEYHQETRSYVQRQPDMKNVKIVNSIEDFDQDAFDKLMFAYHESIFDNKNMDVKEFKKIINKLINSTDHLGFILLAGIPRNESLAKNLTKWLRKKGMEDSWLLHNKFNSKWQDILFRVRKWPTTKN